jgi:hypothetical protein
MRIIELDLRQRELDPLSLLSAKEPTMRRMEEPAHPLRQETTIDPMDEALDQIGTRDGSELTDQWTTARPCGATEGDASKTWFSLSQSAGARLSCSPTGRIGSLGDTVPIAAAIPTPCAWLSASGAP